MPKRSSARPGATPAPARKPPVAPDAPAAAPNGAVSGKASAGPLAKAKAKPAGAKAKAPPFPLPSRRAAPKAPSVAAPKTAPKAAKPGPAPTAHPRTPKPTASKTPKPTPAAPEASDLPPHLRAMAGRTVEEARTAYAGYVEATERMLDTLDDGSRRAWSGARDVNLRILGFAEANAKAGFDFAERFLKAGDFAQLAMLQRAYLHETTARLSDQMREIQQLTQDATRTLVAKSERD